MLVPAGAGKCMAGMFFLLSSPNIEILHIAREGTAHGRIHLSDEY